MIGYLHRLKFLLLLASCISIFACTGRVDDAISSSSLSSLSSSVEISSSSDTSSSVGTTSSSSIDLSNSSDTPSSVGTSNSSAIFSSSITSTSSSLSSPSTPQTNLAFNKPAIQGSNFNGTFTAALAVNGVTDDFQHTQNTPEAWWEVDLQAPQAISTIDIYNRADACCTNRLTDFYVLVSKVPFDSEELQASRNQAGVVAVHVPGEAGSPSEISIDAIGRYVRVQLVGKNFLHMAEVIVHGSPVAAIPSLAGVVSGSELVEGASLDIEVTTTDDAAVANIELYLNDTLIRTENMPPFTWNLEDHDDALLANLAPGQYQLRARLTDTNGNQAEDRVVFSVVPDTTGSCENRDAIVYLEQTCANSACHGGSAYPLLTFEGLQELPGLFSELNPQEKMIVPGKPEESWLYRKMIGTQGNNGGALMPLGSASPREDVGIINQWIANGADASCGGGGSVAAAAIDPNTLDQNELFSCSNPSGARSSPARLRRILGDEYRRSAQWRADDIELLEPSPGAFFSTNTQDLSVDSGSIDLLFLSKFRFVRPWSDNDLSAWKGILRLEGVQRTEAYECAFEPEMTETCRASYVDLILRKRALFREPRADETAVIRGVLDEALNEPGLDRIGALSRTVFTASLLPGAMFRSEIGDSNGRLSANELALALGHVLSDFPVGAPFKRIELFASDPDAQDRSRGRFTAITKAAEDGSIFDPEVRKALLRKYAFGESEERPDIFRQSNEYDEHIPFRSLFYLAPNIRKFFRQWLDYESLGFKEAAAQTSAAEDVFSAGNTWLVFSAENRFGYSRNRARQPRFDEALDDIIARVVIETDGNNQDVFRELMTTNRFMLPANIVDQLGSLGSRAARFGLVYGIDTQSISTDRDDRWRRLPDRMGVLTHPAWLSAHGDAFEDGPSLVFRGKWIREHLFSQTVPSLEFVMVDAQLAISDPDIRARERVRRATETGPDAQSCRGCHALMNSLGQPFENYNHAGYVRAYDRGEGGIDSSTVITNLPDPALNRSYSSSSEFLAALGNSNYARRGFIRQAFRYFMGRDETLADSCTLNEMETAMDRKGSFIDMLEALVASETFSHRSAGENP